MDAHARTAFTAALVLDRTQQAQDTSPTSAVAVDSACQRLYVGLEDGVLEEHALMRSAAGMRAALAARKHTAKKAILSIHALPEHGLVVILSEDGLVHVLDSETLEGQPLPLRHAVAACVAAPPGCLPRLAAALKPSKRAFRFVVYELPPSGGGAPRAGRPHAPHLVAQTEVPDTAAAVHGMGWVGAQLAVCCGMRYLLVSPFAPGGGRWQELFSVPAELAYWPAMLTTMPDLGRALLVVGPAGIVVDAGGNPVGSALRLEGLGATPRALAAAGAFLLVVSEAAIHVFDRSNGGEVQRLAFAQDLRPLPGQPLYASAAGGDAAAHGGGSSACVAVAGRRIVWLCTPVSPADQARELLEKGDFDAALELIQAGLARGDSWAHVGAAQAALLLLHECRFDEAVRCLEQCSPSTFQPSQLFPLFPTYTAPWAKQVPTHQLYWGLCSGTLPSLESLISRKLRSEQRQQGPGSSGRHSPGHGSSATLGSGRGGGGGGGGGSAASSLFALDRDASSSSGGASPAASATSLRTSSKGQHPGNQQEGAAPPAQPDSSAGADGAAAGQPAGHRPPQNGAALPPGSSEALAQQAQQAQQARQEQMPGQRERRRLQRLAWQGLAQYLFRVRMLDGVGCLPGVDTLLLLLLADLAEPRQVAAFAAVPNQVDVRCVEQRLQAEQWHHALATLHAARGHAELALRTWCQVADGQLAAPASPSVQAMERREALESAAALLRDPAACPDATLVSYIPWLLAASQPTALDVLTARNLTPASVLPLLPAESDVRWQYLAHLVEAGATSAGAAGTTRQSTATGANPAIHTELATQLVAAILRAEPLLRSPGPPGGGAPSLRRRLSASRRASGLGGGAAAAATRPGSAAGRRRLARTSTAALVSGGSLEPWAGATVAEAMRLRLQAHLQRSELYDAAAVLRSLQGTDLHEEMVVLHSKLGDHTSALRVLVLTLHDVAAAEAYARAHLAPVDYRTLLHLVLEPGPGLEPRWDDACYLITALGEYLDPQEVLQALPPGMPLENAAAVLAPMLRDRTHRRRQGAVVKNLHRSRLAAAAGVLCDMQAQHVAVGEDRACPHCHLRLGGKVFVVLPPGGGDGAGAGGAAAAGLETGPGAAAAARSLQEQQQDGGRGGSRQGMAGEEQEEGLRPPGEDPLAAAARRLHQAAAAGQEPQVLCFACYRRLSAAVPPAVPASGTGAEDAAGRRAAIVAAPAARTGSPGRARFLG